ncbi:MAG: chromate efflux transporter [Methylophilaceae bacterium]
MNKPDTPSLSEAAWYWLKLGFISFGGPAGQIAIMHEDLVEKKRWISEKRFLHALNYCMLLPGPEAQQLATYIGWLMHRTWGGIIAGSLFVLPSLLIIIGLAWIYLVFGQLPQVAGVLYGIKPAVVAIVLFAAYRIGSRALRSYLLWAIAGAAFVAIACFNVPFPYVILVAALIGYLGNRFAPGKFNMRQVHHAAGSVVHEAVIGDGTPTPPHARFNVKRLILLASAGVMLWLVAFVSLIMLYGSQAVLTQMALFFSKAALLTFGGAYAVLPYVFQGAVQAHGWLSASQMMDGLALGETTPGPLIMVVAFVGFVGGWTHHLFGSDSLFLAGAVAAGVVTFFTFLPSFVFIFVGGPFVESSQGNLKFTAPLTAITAAVVGVILNLAVFFAYHVFWPAGLEARFDWISAVLTLAALAALVRYKINIIALIVIFGLAGLAHHLVLQA